jgi:uncharacterized protein (UPF0332 family)
MNPHEFLELADERLLGVREGDWRSAVSRAYYAAFHVARSLLRAQGFAVPRSDRAHSYLSQRLSNSGHPDVNLAGQQLEDVRDQRTWADYDLHRPLAQQDAEATVLRAKDVVQALEDLQAIPATLAKVIDAIRVYERDVLQDVTWTAPPASAP